MRKTTTRTMLHLPLAAAVMVPLSAAATVWDFSAPLKGNDWNFPYPTGAAVVFYDDRGTFSDLSDDVFTVAVSVHGLVAPPTQAHIHGPSLGASYYQPHPIMVDLWNAPAVHFTTGSSFVGSLTADAPEQSFRGPSLPGAYTFFQALRSGSAYVDVHTSGTPDDLPRGVLRGASLVPIPVPEADAWALMAVGIGLVGWAVSRRRVA